jgi:hypothetical protein
MQFGVTADGRSEGAVEIASFSGFLQWRTLFETAGSVLHVHMLAYGCDMVAMRGGLHFVREFVTRSLKQLIEVLRKRTETIIMRKSGCGQMSTFARNPDHLPLQISKDFERI